MARRQRFDLPFPTLIAQLELTRRELASPGFRPFFEGAEGAGLDAGELRDRVGTLETTMTTAWKARQAGGRGVEHDLGDAREVQEVLTKYVGSVSRRIRKARAARVPGAEELHRAMALDDARDVGLVRMALAVENIAIVIGDAPPPFHKHGLNPAFAAKGIELSNRVPRAGSAPGTSTAARKAAVLALEPLRDEMRGLYRELLLTHEEAEAWLIDEGRLDGKLVRFDLRFLTSTDDEEEPPPTA